MYNLASNEEFSSLQTLLYEPRNTIHGATLSTIAYQEAGGTQYSYIEIPHPTGQKLLDAAEKLGGTKEWGLTSKFTGVLLEPYSYASALVKESLNAINKVAYATDVCGLFQSGQPIPQLAEEAPKNSEFAWGECLSLLA